MNSIFNMRIWESLLTYVPIFVFYWFTFFKIKDLNISLFYLVDVITFIQTSLMLRENSVLFVEHAWILLLMVLMKILVLVVFAL